MNTTYLYSQYTKNSYNSSSKKKKKKTIKSGQRMWIYFSKIDIRMANRQKRCLTLLIVTELKPQWDVTSYLSKWLSLKRQVTGVGEDVMKRGPYALWDYRLVHPVWKTVWWFLTKWNCHMIQHFHIWGFTWKKLKTLMWKRYMNPVLIGAHWQVARIWKQRVSNKEDMCVHTHTYNGIVCIFNHKIS